MKIPLVLTGIFLLFANATIINSTDSNVVRWHENHRLDWTDFKGRINTSSRGDAASTISIRAVPYTAKRQVRYNVEALFHRDQSWCKTPSHSLLAHEQLHFDIAELYARLARRKIAAYQDAGVRDPKKYQRAIQEILNQSNEADKAYDRQTLHGSLRGKQREWENRVRFEIMALDEFRY